ncbi:MAG: hypothetical protein COU07_03800 [Candidatus Harrisonbacteria bacterium CG10_big_fil_rev_8_21_14_0_10_40_38]|uniref:Uncharacterized protein n=1 Tax=Candidatus Harrisonbacteria bacterium CG10_big_fil_rev_8_21_14_0_10_40_38 TaxID=1974583 RepID=A0A2H0UTK8_9BACT|nr:MAG: hypothetical protein COU07_03800 [Candidatus Harrisonbacteria bacterium CG10_big_fil_rev_8_21_14_0_10_40_38]
MKNKLFAIVIITGSLITAVFIIGTNAVRQKTISLKDNYDSFIEKNSYVEEIPKKGFEKQNIDSLNKTEINLTALLAEQISSSFSKDSSLNLLKENTNSDHPSSPEEMVQKLGLEKINDLGLNVFEAPKINISDFNVVKSQNPKESLKKYSENFSEIISKYGRSTILPTSEPNSSDLKKSAEGIQNLITALYKIEVPEEISEIHLKQVSLLTLQKEIYISLSNIQTDPVKALIGLEELPNISEKFKNLKKEAELIFEKNS